MKVPIPATRKHTGGKVAHKLFHVLYPIWCVLSDNNEHDDGTGEKGRHGSNEGERQGKGREGKGRTGRK